MKTHETHYATYPYDFFFRVFDNKEKIVTIELEEEWGVSSMPCETWEAGLADAIITAKEYADVKDLVFSVFFHDMISDRKLFMEKLAEYNKK